MAAFFRAGLFFHLAKNRTVPPKGGWKPGNLYLTAAKASAGNRLFRFAGFSCRVGLPSPLRHRWVAGAVERRMGRPKPRWAAAH